jgi:hypothetical protein
MTQERQSSASWCDKNAALGGKRVPLRLDDENHNLAFESLILVCFAHHGGMS